MTDDVARSARAAQRAVAVSGVVCAVSAIWLLTLADDVALSDTRESVALAATAMVLSVFFAGLFWVRWFRALFAPFQRRRLTRFQEGWPLWAWVVPGVELAVPKMLVNDVWWNADGEEARDALPWQVQAWWVLWVGTRYASFASQWHPQDVGDDGESVVFGALLAAVLAICAPLAVATIGLLTRRAAALDGVDDGTSQARVDDRRDA